MAIGHQTDLSRDEKVSIYALSRYGSGSPILRNERNNQVRHVAGVLARIFGGATAKEIANKAERVVGTYRHGAFVISAAATSRNYSRNF